MQRKRGASPAMTDDRNFEESLQNDLKRWAEAGAPSFDLGGALAQRARAKRNRWRRWGSVAATLLLLSTAVTATFPAWAATAANWPLVGEPIRAYMAERAGLTWAYQMGFYQANLAELTDGKVTLRVLGVIADPIQTKVFYQVEGVNMAVSPEVEDPASLSITGIDGVGGVSSYYPIHGFNTTDTYYVGETNAITAEQAVLNLKLQVGELVKEIEIPVNPAASARYFKEIPVAETQTHGPVSITVEKVTVSPAEVVLSYKATLPPGSKGWTSRGGLAQPILKAGGAELTGRLTGNSGVNYENHLAFPRVHGQTQFVIPSQLAPIEVNARWDWAPGGIVEVLGVPVTLHAITDDRNGLWVEWSYPADSLIYGFGGFTVIGKDGTRVEQEMTGTSTGGDERSAFSGVEVKLPEGFEPAAIEVSHAVKRIDGPWVFDLPTLPDKP